MSKLTYAYARSNGDYNAVPIKSGPVKRISTSFTSYYEKREEPFVKIRQYLSEQLAAELTTYIDVKAAYDPVSTMFGYTGTINVVPLDTSACVLNDQYTYCNQHFTQAEIDYAISQTYPERLI